jgi:hypothetical protein
MKTPEEVIADLTEEAELWAAKGMVTRDRAGDIFGGLIKTSGLTTEDAIKRALDGYDPDAHALLCGRAGLLLSRGETLPSDLRAYAASVLLAQFSCSLGERGKGRPTDWPRNAFITMALDQLRQAGVTPTLSPATKDVSPELRSGCQIVAEILSAVGMARLRRGNPGSEEGVRICSSGLNRTICAVRTPPRIVLIGVLLTT